MLQAGSELFEFDEKGFFDEGTDEWILRKAGYELEYEEGHPALSTKPDLKPELNLGKCDCGKEWDHDGVCRDHDAEEKKPVKKKQSARNRKRKGL